LWVDADSRRRWRWMEVALNPNCSLGQNGPSLAESRADSANQKNFKLEI
jgi:hypothetical protein